MLTRKRVLVALAIAVVVGGIYLWFFGVQTGCALIARYNYRKVPEASMVPAPLSDSSISKMAHREVSYFGYEFELPWDDVDDQKSKTVGQIRVTAFHSGNALWFSVFPPKDLLNEVMKTEALDVARFQQLYGARASDSDYDFHQAMLEVTPSQIMPFVSKRRAVIDMTLLLVKTISMPPADTGIFSIRTPDFEGFQFEGTDRRPRKLTVELYSKDGGIDVIFFQKIDGSAHAISQPEINRVIQSIRKISTVMSDEKAQK
ncbi:MAG TPA: hypothetical protein VKB26_01125 [Candidatus Acidoferrales bacterium]|nr:hypothetical protein [Candidatus Acidoferrales bacterium]